MSKLLEITPEQYVALYDLKIPVLSFVGGQYTDADEDILYDLRYSDGDLGFARYQIVRWSQLHATFYTLVDSD